MSTSVGTMMLAGGAKPVVEKRSKQAGFARGVIIAGALSALVWLIAGYFIVR